MVDIVLQAILFQPFEYQGVYMSFWDATKQPWSYDIKGTLMQIWKSANIFVFIWK